jgi:type IV secretion system protein VirD4
MLPRFGSQLEHFKDKELASTITSANRHLRGYSTPAVAESTSSSTFDPSDLRKKKMTVYLVLPPEHMRAQMSLMRMWLGTFLRAIVRCGVEGAAIVHFLIDEAASLQQMECINDAIDKYRGHGVRLQLYYQSRGQPKSCFPKDGGQTLLSNVTQVYFATADYETAEEISRRCGDQTVVVESGGSGRGDSTQSANMGHKNHGHSTNASDNWSQVSRRLLKPEEILALDERIAITFVQGLPPILTRLERYYEGRIGPPRFQGIKTVLGTIFMLAMGTFVATIATLFARGVSQ